MSHITGAAKRTLARLVKRYGSANVLGETHEIAGKRNPRRPSQRIEVQCQECGKVFSTASMLPSCPRCGGSDIDLANPRQFRHRRVRAPGRFAKGSLRTIRAGKARVIVGHLKGEQRRTRTGRRRQTVQAVLVPKRNPRGRFGKITREQQKLLRFVWRAITDALAHARMSEPLRQELSEAMSVVMQMAGGIPAEMHTPQSNPTLAVVGAMNPPIGEVVELRYYRRSGKHPGWYKHRFSPRATLTALGDGSLRIR